MPVSAQAPSAVGTAGPAVSLDARNASLPGVLRTMFSRAGKNLSLDSAVQGTVNVTLNGVSFDTALRTLMAASSPPLTYDIQDGVYHIHVTPAVPASPLPLLTPIKVAAEGVHSYRLPIDSYDAGYLASMLQPKTPVTLVLPNYVNPARGIGSATVNGRGRNGRNASSRGSRNGGRRRPPGY